MDNLVVGVGNLAIDVNKEESGEVVIVGEEGLEALIALARGSWMMGQELIIETKKVIFRKD